jgi:AraC-like DNA-binding protein
MACPLSIFSLVQSNSARFRKLAIAQPMLILVRSGQKRVKVGRHTMVAKPGEAIALSGGALADVRNEAPPSAAYRADVFSVANSILRVPLQAAPSQTAHGAFSPPAALIAHLDRLREEAPVLPDTILKHRIHEVAIWLSALGIGWRSLDRPNLSFLVRDFVAQEPSRRWTLSDIRKLLAGRGHALSEASLRRRLAGEGATFTSLVIDARMTVALERLQTSSQSITRIALEVGYESASRFAVRFRARFGIAPSGIRDDTR